MFILIVALKIIEVHPEKENKFTIKPNSKSAKKQHIVHLEWSPFLSNKIKS